MNQDEWIYFSYSNDKLALALKLGRDLMSKGFSIWLDHLVIAPNISWADTVLDKQSKSQAALLLLNSSYLASEYCIQELNQLQAQNALIIALCLDTNAIEQALQNFSFDMVLDFRQHRGASDYETFLENLETSLKTLGFFTAFISDERIYLLELIASLELALSQTSTGRLAARNTLGISWQGRKIRPRCHAPEAWLFNGQFALYEPSLGAKTEQASHLVLSNILEWLEWRSRMMLVGEAGTGKTSLLQTICLSRAFQRLEEGMAVPIPCYLEIANWQAGTDILSFVKQSWPLNGDIAELLQRSGIMLFVDGLGESIYPNAMPTQEIAKLLDSEMIAALIITAREDALDFTLPSNLSFIQISDLHETQIALIADSVFPEQSFTAKPCSVEVLASRLSTQLLAPEAHELNWQQQLQYLIPAAWEQVATEYNQHFTCKDLTNGLEAFAIQSYAFGQATYYPYQIALQSMGDELLLYLALNLGILERRAQQIRFASTKLALYLAANKLLLDGVYQYLSHPHFDSEGERLTQTWDEVILFATQLMAVADIPLFIQVIADIDPYLAFQCAQLQATVLPVSLRDIISKLLEPRRNTLRSISLSKQIMAAVTDKDTLANILIDAMQSRDDWPRRELAFEFLRDLPMPESDTAAFAQAIESIEPSFPDSVYNVLEALSDSKSILLLCQLAVNGTLAQRIRAIYLLGELSHSVGAVVLSQLSMEEASSVLISAANALAKLKDKQALAFLYLLLLHPDTQVIRAAETTLLQIDAGLKTAVLLFLSCENALNQALTQSLLAISNEALSQLLAYVLGNLGYGHSHSIDLASINHGSGDMVRHLLDLLSSKMASLSSREAFQDFADDMLNRVGIYRDEEELHVPPRSQMVQRVRVQKPSAPLLDTSHTATKAIPERLVLGLKNEDWLVRQQSVEQLSHYPPALTVNWLLLAIKDSDSQVRIAALKAFPDPLEYPLVLDALLSTLDDADYQVVDAAAERLRATDAPLVPALLKKLQSLSDYALATVIELLGQKGDETVVTAIADYMDDVREPWMWNHCIGDIAVRALLTIGSPEALELVQASGRIAYPILNDIILPGSDDALREETPRDFDTFEILLKDLHSESWQVSQEAARQMREIAQGLQGRDNDALAQRLSECLSDPNWVVRWTVLETLAWLRTPSILPTLLLMLDDENWMVKIASIHALVELKAKTAARQIEALLFHSNTAVREAAAEALRELGNSEVLASLRECLNDTDQFVRLAVIRAIISLNDSSQDSLLVDALRDSYSHVRWYAIRALAQIAESKHLRAIVPLLRDTAKPAWEKYSISNYAELALRRMNSPASKQVLEKWAKVKRISK